MLLPSSIKMKVTRKAANCVPPLGPSQCLIVEHFSIRVIISCERGIRVTSWKKLPGIMKGSGLGHSLFCQQFQTIDQLQTVEHCPDISNSLPCYIEHLTHATDETKCLPLAQLHNISLVVGPGYKNRLKIINMICNLRHLIFNRMIDSPSTRAKRQSCTVCNCSNF